MYKSFYESAERFQILISFLHTVKLLVVNTNINKKKIVITFPAILRIFLDQQVISG